MISCIFQISGKLTSCLMLIMHRISADGADIFSEVITFLLNLSERITSLRTADNSII